jgi:predicted MFS family arabinose efflux permease
MSAFSVLVGFQHNFYASCALMALTGFCTIQCTTQSNTLIQMRAEDGMRGRVMSVMNLVFGGVTPIGSLYAGALIEAAGASLCLAASGGIGILAAGATSLAVFRSAAKPGAKK